MDMDFCQYPGNNISLHAIAPLQERKNPLGREKARSHYKLREQSLGIETVKLVIEPEESAGTKATEN